MDEDGRAGAYELVRSEVAAGHQAYVITPLVSESDRLEVKSAEAEAERLATKVFPDLRVDVLHGHSSHHPKAVELYRGKLILYGCGDIINDYEGISGRDEFRGDLALMYLPQLAHGSGELVTMELVALSRRRLRLERASEIDCRWLCGVLNTEGERFGTAFEMQAGSRFVLARRASS